MAAPEIPGFKTIAPPGIDDEPVTLAQAKVHLRLADEEGDEVDTETGPDDELIKALITASREYAEGFCGKYFAGQVVETTYSAWPASGAFPLLRGPLRSVVQVTYNDVDGIEQTLPDTVYALDDYVQPPVLYLKTGQAWPALTAGRNAVRLRQRLGFDPWGSNDTPSLPVPGRVRAAILLMVGHLYENREAVTVKEQAYELPMAVEILLRQDRVLLGMA